MTSVIAHRGASRIERENTVAAFRRAVELGAHGIELDVRCSGDGVLVVHHDPECMNAAQQPMLICETARADLPDHIPTLAEALEASAGAFVNIEIKNSPEEAAFDPQRRVAELVVAALTDRERLAPAVQPAVDAGVAPFARWVISSFDRGSIDRVRDLAPWLATAWLAVRPTTDDLADLAAAGHTGVHPWEPALTAELVDEAHARGLFVATWTCNDAERMLELASWGVDGIITDLPDLGIATLGIR